MPIQIATFRSPVVLDKHPDEVLIRSIDFALQLPSGATLTGTPTAEIAGESGCTITNVAIVETAVQFTISGGAVRTAPYTITATVGVTSGAGNSVFVGQVQMRVVGPWT